MSELVKQEYKKGVTTWLISGCVLIYFMVVIGGITRLTHSGLSMVDWNMLLGSLPPMSDADWQIPFEKYKQSPEYIQLNSHYTLEEFKSIYWWEYIHRFLGRTIGVIFIIPFIYFLAKKSFTKYFLKRLLILLALGGFQGLLGWYMVKSGLVNKPYVSHYRLAAHLISAFMVFGFNLWLILHILMPKEEISIIHRKRQLALTYILFAIVLLQIIYGAFVSGLKAGLLYPTFPKMDEEWIPESVYAIDPLWKNFLENGAGVQFIHRILGFTVLTITLLLFYRIKTQYQPSGLHNKTLNFILTIVIIQFCLGIATLLLGVPVVIATLHQTGAFILFGSLLFLIYVLKNKR